jgi:START domain
MGQYFSNMCSCFDSSAESNQEFYVNSTVDSHLNKPLNFNENLNNYHIDEINGFSYEQISKNIQPTIENFLNLVKQGIKDYDVIIDKENCKVYSKEAPEGYILKYTWNIPYTQDEFMNFMDKSEMRQLWDKNIEFIKIIGRYTPNEAIVNTRYKKYLAFDMRETLAFTKTLKLDGNPCSITFTIESDNFPVPDKVVRVKLFTAGVYTETIPPDQFGNTTKITCLSHMDVGLPRAMNNMARKFAGASVPPITQKIVTEMKKHLGR